MTSAVPAILLVALALVAKTFGGYALALLPVEGDALGEALDLARAATGVDRVRVEHKPRLLSDNGSCYIAKDLAAYLQEQDRLAALVRETARPDPAPW